MDVLSSAAIDLEIRRSFPFLNVGPLFTDLLIPVPQFRYYLAVLVQLLISHQFTLFIRSSIYYIQLFFFSSIEKKKSEKVRASPRFSLHSPVINLPVAI